jgi:hypothetical protein
MRTKDKSSVLIRKVNLTLDNSPETSFESEQKDTEPISWITTEPRIPPIQFDVTLPDCTLNGNLNYSAHISYAENGRNDVSDTFHGTIPSLSLTIDFGDVVRGGTLQINLEVPVITPDGKAQTLTYTYVSGIRGTNPSKADVKSALGDIEFKVIAYKESKPKFKQFDERGLPIFGPPHGFGIMQLDNPPASARQLWDWRQNIEGGKSLFRIKEKELRQYFKNVRKVHPEAPELTADQFRLAYYQYYNGGVYWGWNDKSKRWEKVGITKYGDNALRIENLVKSGTPPPGWD